MAPTQRPPALGEFELLVLLSTMGLKDDAYPFAITRELEGRTGRPASRAAVLITLERLEEKELVSSKYGGATPERGGRKKRYFEIKPRGLTAVQEALDRIQAMTAGLEGVIKRR
jgi:DNA-binding PadR family transcriptional regulator